MPGGGPFFPTQNLLTRLCVNKFSVGKFGPLSGPQTGAIIEVEFKARALVAMRR